MPNYTYKGSQCGNYCERFVRELKTPSEDENHGAHCECGIEVCFLQRTLSRPQKPGGLKVWAGDWFKKTYGFDMLEGAYRKVAETEQYKKDVRELAKQDVHINPQSKEKTGNDRIKYKRKE